MFAPSLIHYRVPGAGGNLFPGAHASQQPGQGFMFREHDTLVRSQEQKRIDIHASLKNPFGEIMVRTFNQKSAVSVQVVADISRSMGIPDNAGKLSSMVSIIESLAYSAYRHGDKFALVPCNDDIDTDRIMPLSADITAVNDITAGLDESSLAGGCSALPAAHRFLGRRRGLVFLLSDFLFERKILEQTILSFARQVVVPVVIRQPLSSFDQPSSGMVTLQDAESGKRRSIFMRRRIRRQYRQNHIAFYEELQRYFLQQGIRPLLVEGQFDPDQFSAYFYS